jgi:hypothetical protein
MTLSNASRSTCNLAFKSATRISTSAFFSFAAAKVALASATASFFGSTETKTS